MMFALCLLGCKTEAGEAALAAEPTVIAFGSCAKHGRAQPIWDAVVATKPDLFIFAGDNIYGDTSDMALMQAKYDKLGAQPGYQKLLKTCPVLAVYDDHDYGANNVGKEFPKKKESAKMCLDFFGVPEDSPRRQREGIYGSQIMGEPGQRVQIILLDMRYFRDKWDGSKLTPAEKKAKNIVGVARPTDDTTRTLLGKDQWAWLEKELKKEADVRLIVSSIQVVTWEKGMECWGNMPHERDRLFKLIETTEANGVVFLSGDVHFSELSLSKEGPYPLYDLTASGLNQRPPKAWPDAINGYRLPGKVYADYNFGVVRIEWAGKDTNLNLQARTLTGEVAYEHVVPLTQLGKASRRD